MNEKNFLNNNTLENKIINFYSLYKINLQHEKTIESYQVNRLYYKILNNSKVAKIRNLITYFEDLKNDIKDGLTASIGKDINNNEISINIVNTPHLLIAGSTGSGKSCILNNIIVSLLNKYNADKMQMILIDIKQVEFTPYKNKNQLAIPTITSVENAIDILNKMIVIMTYRYNTLSQKNYRNIEEYNQKEAEKMPNYIIVIDELADLFAQSPDIENILCRLLQLGRAAGIHLILATQRPDSETISGKLKINMPTRIALTVTNAHDSRTILNESGAEKLTGKGDFLLKKANGETIRGQGAFIKNIMEVLKND